MSSSPCVKASDGLLLLGQQIIEGGLNRNRFLKEIDLKVQSFRDAGDTIGALKGARGARFFDSSRRGDLRFGPGAGLIVGVSLGTSSLHAALVDANGILHHPSSCEPLDGQLELTPEQLLDRIRDIVEEVLTVALEDPGLLVDGALPFLGIAVGWSVPMDRDRRPVGYALRDRTWQNGVPLNQRVAQHLNIEHSRSHALNHAHAAAIAVAWRQSRSSEHHRQPHPRMAIAMRVAGSVSAATIVVEPPSQHRSGFLGSILLGGVDWHAGELGHVPVNKEVIAARNLDLPAGLGPLKADRCSCTDDNETTPDHLEAYTSAAAVAARVAPGEPVCEVVQRIMDAPDTTVHRRALEDLGTVLGSALLAPVAMLNPATITLTGSLAAEIVRKTVGNSLANAQPFGRAPEVLALEGQENQFVRVQGAALAVLRAQVHRRFEELVGGGRTHVHETVRQLTRPMTKLPWS